MGESGEHCWDRGLEVLMKPRDLEMGIIEYTRRIEDGGQ